MWISVISDIKDTDLRENSLKPLLLYVDKRLTVIPRVSTVLTVVHTNP